MRTLSDLKAGEKSVVEKIVINGDMKRRFLDLGLISGTEVECVGVSPAGDPKAYCIRGAVIAIRNKDGNSVLVN